MDLDKEFKKARKLKERNFGKLVQLQKRFFDEWAMERFRQEGYKEFKMSYMAILMNIEEDGISNKELAIRAHVTKQAMSKVMKELDKLGLVESKTNEEDARMSLISLTEKGKRVVITVVENVCAKMDEYEALVGKKRFQEAMDTMYILLDYERQKLGGKKLRTKII